MTRRHHVALSVLLLLIVLVVTQAASSAGGGTTMAPDATGATFRAGPDAEHAAVDVTWDAAAKADSGGSGSARLITLDGVGVGCLTPATGSPGASGGTAPGGNMTSTWTLICGPITQGAYHGQTPSPANTARLVILGDSAADETHTHFNGLEQVDFSAGGQTHNLPDLVGITLEQGVHDAAGNTVDKAVYTFNRTVEVLKSPAAFGVTPIAGGDENTIADSGGPFPGDGPEIAGTTVRIYFAAGTLAHTVQAFVDGEGISGAGDHLNAPGQASVAGAPAVGGGGTTGGGGGTTGGGTANPATDHAKPTMGTVSAPRYVSGDYVGPALPPLYIQWKGAVDKGSGVASYIVEARIGKGAYKRVATTKQQFAHVRLNGSGAYQFRVTAVDRNGNRSKPITIPGRLRRTLLQESDRAITYGGSWKTASSPGAFGGKVRRSFVKGATVTVTFTGRELAWVSPTSRAYGTARVSADGHKLRGVSLYRAAAPRRIVHVWTWTKDAPHRVSITVDGSNGHPRVDVDAFVVVS